ncbi:MAG TPA: hypothetical protein VMT62_00785 [Syntrophorhabdaceae bacterium]|nr:hypothetical protein [Syntrophorhabdaceae bacterium]
MKNWMKTLATHYETMRERYPQDRLLIVFDIDGTILDMRHTIRYVLRCLDEENGTDYFAHVAASDIDFGEEHHIDRLFKRLHVPEVAQPNLRADYEKLMFSSVAIPEAYRPFPAILDVIRWFQLQPNTYVGFNTARFESAREHTLRCLNELGKEYRVAFVDDMLFMRCDESGGDIPDSKQRGITYFREQNYRVFAFVDNESENLKAVSENDPDKEIHLLHAETVFRSAPAALTPHGKNGKVYDLTRSAPEEPSTEHIQFVWPCDFTREGLGSFMGSNINWLEIDLKDVQKVSPVADGMLSLEECLDFASIGGKGIKFNVHESKFLLNKAMEIADAYKLQGSSLWFKLGDTHILRGNHLAALRYKYPLAVIEYNVDYLSESLLNEAASAREILELMRVAGIDRFSLNRSHRYWRLVVNVLTIWKFDVHINNVMSFETFLQAALLYPRSLTLHLGFSEWRYFEPLLERIA